MLNTLLLLITCGVPAAEPVNPRLTLPPRGYAVVGAETGLWFDNVVLDENPTRYRFKVASDLGKSDARHWSTTPSAAEVGDHTLKIEVLDNDQSVATGSMTWSVIPANAAAEKPLRILIVGDSLTHATLYPNDLARRLSEPGQPKWTMLGTHKPSGAKPGVAHEGYGGWTWERFARHYEPNPDPAARKISSPFVFLVDDKPSLDVARYIKDACGGQPPDVVFFLLGINDCFHVKPDDPQAINARIDQVFQQADTLLNAFRQAAPNADLAIGLTTPGNERQGAFFANYQDRYTRWGWKRIQHRLVERQLQKYAGRESERVFIVPTELGLDPVDGYPDNNGVHPNPQGYAQIAASLHAWLITRLSQRQ